MSRERPARQFDSAKLGMWLFLASEILLFGGLFCAYAVYRAGHPEVFAWGHHLLNTKLGAINTVVLLCSSLTMAWAARCAQLGRRAGLIVLLWLTLAGGFGFLGIKYVEYRSMWRHGLLWGKSLAPDAEYVAGRLGASGDDAGIQGSDGPLPPGDPLTGKNLFLETCHSCHGARGRGIPLLGADLVGSNFLAESDDRQLLEFLRVGRQPLDPRSTMKRLMPPRGGDPTLTDDKLIHLVAYLRELQPVEEDGEAEPPADRVNERAGPFVAGASRVPRPHNAQLFFNVYFLMTGLHGVHVVLGMLILAWLLRRATRGEFDAGYHTPVDLGGLYWHLVDLIWIFLFPLLYLIH